MTFAFFSNRRLAPWRGAGVAFACWALLAGAYSAQWFQGFDLKLTDARFALRHARPASERIAIVEVDDETVRAYGRWPLPREQYALLIQALGDAGAAAIGLDVQFLGPEHKDPLGDALLVRVSAMSPNVVHSMSFQDHVSPGDTGGRLQADSIQALIVRHGTPDSHIRAAAVAGVAIPFEQLTQETPALGHVSVVVDPDGTLRRVAMFERYGDHLFPALALRLVAIADGDTLPPRAEPVRGGAIIRWGAGHRLFAPIDDEGATALDYAGGRESFPSTHSMLRLLQWYKDGKIELLRRAVQGKIVLVGSTAVAEVATDIGPTPFAENSPLMFVHANALDSILQGRFLRGVPSPLYLGLLAGLSLLLGVLFASLTVPVAATMAAGVTLALFGVNTALFAWAGIDVPPTMALLLGPLCYAAIETYRYVFLERSARERDRELQVARKIQQKLLPVTPPAHPELDVHGLNIPAQEVGGDYFDWILLEDGSVLLALGDVSGKGVAAALLMSHLRASLHSESRVDREPVDIVTAMHRSLSRAVEGGRFATFFLARITPDGSRLTYCNAGHNPAFIVRRGAVQALNATGIPLAMVEQMGYEQAEETLAPGDVLVIYSDGVTECPRNGDPEGELYDADDGHKRFWPLLERLAAGTNSAEGIGRAILADVDRWCRGQLGADDVTIVVARRR